MNKLLINGYGDNLQINDIKLGDLSPQEHEQIEKNKGGQNYSPLEDVVVSHVKDSSTLICRKPSKQAVENYVEEELLDGLCCYSAVNQGQLYSIYRNGSSSAKSSWSRILGVNI